MKVVLLGGLCTIDTVYYGGSILLPPYFVDSLKYLAVAILIYVLTETPLCHRQGFSILVPIAENVPTHVLAVLFLHYF